MQIPEELLQTIMPYLGDAALVLIVLAFAFIGRYRGAAKSLAGVLSAAAGIIGGIAAGKALAKPVAERFIVPRLAELLSEKLGLTRSVSAEELVQPVRELSRELNIPAYTLDNVEQAVAGKLEEGLSGLVEFIALKLAMASVFIVVFLIVFIIAKLLFKKIVPKVAKLPVIKQCDRFLGFVLGLAAGLILSAVAFVIVCRFVPSFTAEGGPLCAANIDRSLLVKYYYLVLSPILG